MESFLNFIHHLKERLQHDLPGEPAQLLMAPAMRRSMIQKPIEEYNPRKGAVLILFYPKDDEIAFPLILRSTYEGIHSNQVGFPGGKNETGETMVDTALRETFEEIGVKISDMSVIGGLSELYIPPSNFLVFPVVAYMNYAPIFSPDKREVEILFEYELKEFFNDGIKEEMDVQATAKLSFKAPCYTIQNQVIWGATAMIISELVELIKELPLDHSSFR